MRNYNGDRTGTSLIKSTFVVKGLNLDRLINHVQRKNIVLYDVKKTGAKRMLVSVKLSDGKKFFAITKELCYNVKKVRDKGVGYPVYYLIKNFGLVLGATIFIAIAVFFNDVIFEISFSGSGKVYGREVKEYLTQIGVEKYSRFSSVDLDALGDKILQNNKHFSFVECEKKGNRLNVELALSTDNVDRLDGNVYELFSDVDGVVESITVYRGTAVVSVGDVVKKGDLLVGGYAVIKEQTVKINLLATVTIIAEKEHTYYSEKDNEERTARIFAEQEHGGEILSGETSKTFDGSKYVYKTTLKVRRVLFAG